MPENTPRGPVESFLLTRRSVPVLKEPGPSREVLADVLACAASAPDHARLKPWRFEIFSGPARERLGAAYVQGMRHESPGQSEAFFERLSAMPMRAPVILMSVACLQPHPKVPEHEQMIAAALASYHVQLALAERGFDAVWRTGPVAESDGVRKALGLAENERIVGFVYIGTAASEPPPRQAVDVSARVRFHD